MPWKDTSVEDVRYRFILSLHNRQGSFGDVCAAFGISCKTGYKWERRYREEGKAGLIDKRRTPVNRPRDTPPDVEAAIVTMQIRHPYWGAKKLKQVCDRDYPEIDWPCLTTFGNVLERNGFTSTLRKRAKLAGTAPLRDCRSPNDMWSADFKGWWHTTDGTICEPFTVSDGDSRFLLCCQHVKRRNFDSVWSHLKEVFEEYGMPLRFRTDNGPPFASTSIGRLSHLAIRLIRLGITPEWITPGKPQENGRHERMHRTLKLEAASPPSSDLRTQQARLDKWMYQYNFIRPHEALNMLTPSEVYFPSKRVWTGEEQDPVYPDGYEQRRVDKGGEVRWRGKKIFTTELLRHQNLGFRELEVGGYDLHFGPVFLGTIDPISGFKRV